jgi:hypothetical protein
MRKTEHYQLNLWDAEDAILREDFNADNEKIEAALADIAAGGVKIANGHYTGDGASAVHLNVGFNPKLLIICGPDPDYRMMYLEGMTSVYTYVKRGATTAYSYAVTVEDGTVSWGTNSERSYFLNADGTKYFWFAVG